VKWSIDAVADRILRLPYLLTERGRLLARDAQGSFPGWKCVGTIDGADLSMTADEERLYRVRGDGQVVVRPAEPAPHEWQAIGPALEGGGRLCAAGGRLLCVKADFTLWQWEQPGGWRPAGGWLYCLDTRDGKQELWSRPIAGKGDWERAVGDPVPPPLAVPEDGSDPVRLGSWRGELLAWAQWDRSLFARPVGPGPALWRLAGARHPDFLKRW
jgi:hypothetical protein